MHDDSGRDDDGNGNAGDAMDKSKIEHLNKQEYTNLPHAEQDFEAHEQTDVAIRPLVITLVVLAAVVAASYVGMAGVFTLFDKMEKNSASNPKLSNVDSGMRRVPEGMPALQGVQAAEANPNTAAQDMELLRKRNGQVMSGAGPMRAGLKPGMPIDRAMDEAMSQNLFKTRAGGGNAGGQGAADPSTAPTTGPAGDGGGDAGSGQAK